MSVIGKKGDLVRESKCISKKKCKFRVYAKQLRGEGGTFQIRSMDLAHMCRF